MVKEPRSVGQSNSDSGEATTNYRLVDESMESEIIHLSRMGYVEYHKSKADACYDR